ncbi:hypothetical protein PROPHIGD54-2_80 [Mycobacterium phage prophiGD54-2]|uniref:hypothetical protein n=1 Tax=Mycobacteroides abscessus TaxID=36809 RepID=UPI0019D2EB31|nr:hypothetical protein [Mycobacteroides abscessus]QSM04680.1 hypothetical protein PROPHIGD54-2_80 [Mycobacterium phage prophiGD54-2]QSN19625.1 hypothetical protein I3U41_17100 [Mycobacteroides abscessus subsp. abscessus]
MDGNDWGATASLNGSIQSMAETIATQKTTIRLLSNRLDKAKSALSDIRFESHGVRHRHGAIGALPVDPLDRVQAIANRCLEELRA